MRNSFSFDKKQKNDIDVMFYYSGRDKYARPVSLTWDGQDYSLGGVQFWYTEQCNGVAVHHYQVGDETGDLTFYLSLETDNLTWRLEKVVNEVGVALLDIFPHRFREVVA